MTWLFQRMQNVSLTRGLRYGYDDRRDYLAHRDHQHHLVRRVHRKTLGFVHLLDDQSVGLDGVHHQRVCHGLLCYQRHGHGTLESIYLMLAKLYHLDTQRKESHGLRSKRPI